MPRRICIVVALLLCLAAVYLGGLHHYLTLDGLQARYGELLDFYERRPALVILCFMAIQVMALALSLPGAVLSLALAAGALFGAMWGTIIVLVSLTVGDSLGFLIARYVLRAWFEKRLGPQLEKVQAGVEKEGAFYLLALRLMAVVPYFVVNVAMALTRMKLRVFAPVSFIGLIPATMVYVNAGTALTEIQSAGDLLSPRLIAVFVALGALPLIFRFAFRRRFAS